MSDSIIKVSSLSKRYRLGLKENPSETLLGQISQVIRSPWQNLKRLRALSRFGLEDESVFWALKDVSFEVKEGDVLGIIGKNGAGKSTLLKILSQITDPTSGKVEIHGRVASLLEVGTGFHPELSGRENIYMNGTILGMTRREIDSKLDEIIEFSGVEKFIDTPVKFYSSGMKVRLGFSVAAHLDPEILIIDEVLAVGDYEFQKKCIGKIESVSKQGRTIIFVSHSKEAISEICNKVILLESGLLISEGETRKILSKYYKEESSFRFKIDQFQSYNFRNSNEKIEISKLYLASNGKEKGIFELNEEINLIIHYNVKSEGLIINLSISVYGPNMEYILASPSNSDSNWYQKKHPIGSYIANCILPPFLFNDQRYFISVLMVENGHNILLDLEKVLSFSVYDDGVGRSNFYGTWSGLIRPRLIWEVSKTS